MKNAARTTLLLLAVAACTDTPPSAPRAIMPTEGAARDAVPNDPCSIRWASGTAGSWFDATKWSPAGVPAAGSSVCIDAPGAYTVTLDPTDDAVPINMLALTVGGSGAAPTLRFDGTAAIVNVGQGIDIKAGATMDLRNFSGATVTAQRAVTNAGTLAVTAACGSCGRTNVLTADVTNTGTWNNLGILTLGKTNGVYENSGAIVVSDVGSVTIPASAGAPMFAQNGGTIQGTANSSTLLMQSGTFTMNGGKARQRIPTNAKPTVILDGAKLVLAPSATDSTVIGFVGSATPGARVVSGNIAALTSLWLTGPTGVAGSITLDGNPTNAGVMVVVRQIDQAGGELTLAGSGRLTNNRTIDQARNSGIFQPFHYTLDVTNNASWLVGPGASLEKAGGTYVNAGTMDMGPTSSVAVTTITGSTLTSTNTITGGSVLVETGGRLRATGTVNSSLSADHGGIVEPGTPIGTFTSYAFRARDLGVTRIELGGLEPGTGHDRIDATQTAFLAGTLDIVEANGFLAGRCGQQFDIITHPVPSGAGAFSTVNGLNPAAGRNLRIVYVGATATTKGAVRLVGFDGSQKICVGNNPIAITEGGPGAQYAIALDHAPTSNVTVSATPDAQVTVSPATLVFTASNWQAPQYFTVTAVNDAASEGTHTGRVTHAVATTDATYSGVVPAMLTANITDDDTNLPPNAGNDAATTAEDTPVTVSVLANDSDPEGKPLTVTNVTNGAKGSAQVTGGGTTVTYTPSANANGQDNVVYTVSDGTATRTGTVSITITPVNDRPTAVNDQASGRGGTAITIAPLANDVDVDGDAMTITQVSTPAHGTATLSGSTITYRTTGTYFGADQFTYTIRDPAGLTSTATVNVATTDPNANEPPSTRPDFVAFDRSFGIIRIDPLDNDFDFDGDALSLVSVQGAQSGIAVIVGRSIYYTITRPSTGRDFLVYQVRDSRGATATERITVTWPVPGTSVDVRLTGVYSSAVRTATATGEPVAWLHNVVVPITSNALATTPVVMEVQLPPGTLSAGYTGERTRGLDLPVQDNCVVVRSGAAITGYRCIVQTGVAAIHRFMFSLPPNAAGWSYTVTVTPQAPVTDPNPGNNTIRVDSANCRSIPSNGLPAMFCNS